MRKCWRNIFPRPLKFLVLQLLFLFNLPMLESILTCHCDSWDNVVSIIHDTISPLFSQSSTYPQSRYNYQLPHPQLIDRNHSKLHHNTIKNVQKAWNGKGHNPQSKMKNDWSLQGSNLRPMAY